MFHRNNIPAIRTYLTALIWCGLCILGVLWFRSGYLLNITRSFPVGLYEKVNAVPGKGDLVLVCPDATPVFQEALERHFIGYSAYGICPSRLTPVVKQLVALHGDHVRISQDGVTVNGRDIPNSRPLMTMRHGVTYPVDETLGLDEILVMSSFALSFDARYFGILKTESIMSILRPLYILD